MRISRVVGAVLGAALMAAPVAARAQVDVSVRFGTRLGPEIGVVVYAPERHGDWHRNYRKWTPVVLYDVNGRYYSHQVEGARAVMVYSYNGEYFFPPTDREWVGFDRRYDYHRAPADVDIHRARPYAPPVVVSPRFGVELGVVGYSVERAGDWRHNYRRWTPVTVYEFNGRYYPNPGPGARPVQIYRFQGEYFLPPADREWVGFDRRFDYKHAPSDDDRHRVRDRP
ncbi:MAG TPA: hypothetical protein VN613_06980 [Gemmatimonadaceae bacterium]|nr:hypothetical protein [Gemmatimonadaceae bacterium]